MPCGRRELPSWRTTNVDGRFAGWLGVRWWAIRAWFPASGRCLPVSPTRSRRPLKSGDCRAVGKWLPLTACRTRAVAPMHRQPRLRRVRSSMVARTHRSLRSWSAWSVRWTVCAWRRCAMPASYAAAPHTPSPPRTPLSHVASYRRRPCGPWLPYQRVRLLLRAGWGSGGGGRRVVCAEGRG